MNTSTRSTLITSASLASNDTGWQLHLHHNARHQRRAAQEPDISRT